MYLSIHPLNLGGLELDVSFVNWQTGCGTKSWFPTTAWLVLGAQKPIVVDSSFRSVEDALSNQGLTARRSQEQTLANQLAKHGLQPKRCCVDARRVAPLILADADRLAMISKRVRNDFENNSRKTQ